MDLSSGSASLIFTQNPSLTTYSASPDEPSLFINRLSSSGSMNLYFSYTGTVYAGIKANYSSGEMKIGGYNTGYFATMYSDNAEVARFTSGKVGIGVTAPTAVLHLKAGTSTANTSPLKFNSGTNLTTVENGAVEYDGTDYFASAASTRQTLHKGKFGSYSGVGTATTTFTVTFGGTQPNATYKVVVTPTSSLSAALFYVTNKTTTTFDVMYLAGLTGTVTFDYLLTQ
jgi:hypothetical protein